MEHRHLPKIVVARTSTQAIRTSTQTIRTSTQAASRSKRKCRNSFEDAVLKSLSKSLGLSSVQEAIDKTYEIQRLTYTKEYIPDITLPNGIIVELKGYFPPEDRAKMIQVKRSNPELDIRIVFLTNSKLSSRTNLRYLDWAITNGFIAHVTKRSNPSIPLEWIHQNKK